MKFNSKIPFLILIILLCCVFCKSSNAQHLYSVEKTYNNINNTEYLSINNGCTKNIFQYCFKEINEFNLEIEISIEDENGRYLYGPAVPGISRNTSFKITPIILNPCSTGKPQYKLNINPYNSVISNYITIDLHELNTKAKFKLKIDNTTLGYDPSNATNILPILPLLQLDNIIKLEISSFASNNIATKDIKISYKIVPIKMQKLNDLITPTPNYQTDLTVSQNTVTKKLDFSFGCSAPLFQLQVLKIYNNDPLFKNSLLIPGQYTVGFSANQIDWSKALNIYTSKPNFSLTLAEGTGYYTWRVRKINTINGLSESDPLNWEGWYQSYALNTSSTPTYTITPLDDQGDIFVFYYTQFDDDKNWYYTRTIIENEVENYPGLKENLIGESMTFANGLGMVRQTQSFSNQFNAVAVSAEYQDFVGRSAIKTLASVIDNQNNLGYVNGFAGTTFVGPTNFDENTNYKNPDKINDGILYNYYSDNNQDKDVPHAKGYPYTRTRFDRNPLNQVIEASMPGEAHSINTAGEKHTNQTLEGSVADIELIRIFGDEAPPDSSVIKNLSIDPNGQTSITYIDKNGKTLATCLSTGSLCSSVELDPLLSAASSTFTVTSQFNTPRQNENNLIKDSRMVTVSSPTTLNMSYQLQPKAYSDLCANICSTCDYNIIFKVQDVNELESTPIWQGMININPTSMPCSTLTNTLTSFTFKDPVTGLPLSNSSCLLPIGKFVISKIITTYNPTSNTSNAETFLELNKKNLEITTKAILLNLNHSIKKWNVMDNSINPATPVLDASNIPIVINLDELQEKLINKQMTGAGGVFEMLKIVNTSSPQQFYRLLRFVDASNPTCATEIPIIIQSCPAPDCANQDAFINSLYTKFSTELSNTNNVYITTPNTNIESYFKLNNTLLKGLTTITVQQEPVTSLPIPRNYYYNYTQNELKVVIKNMLNDTRYTCENVSQAWDNAIQSVIQFYTNGNASTTATANNLVFNPDFLDVFFNTAGYHLENGTDFVGSISAPSTSKGFLSHPFCQFYYPNPLIDGHTWAATNNTGITAGAAAVISYYNSMCNFMYLQNNSTCAPYAPMNDVNLPSANTSSNNLNPNFYLDPTHCTKDEDFLLGVYKSVQYVLNSSVANANLNIPNPQDLTSMTQYKMKIEDLCLKTCDSKQDVILDKINYMIATETEPVEDYWNAPYLYNIGYGRQTSHVDVWKQQVMENCKNKCVVRLETVPNITPTTYKFNNNDMQEWFKVIAYDIDVKRKQFNNIDNNSICIGCTDLNGVTFTQSNVPISSEIEGITNLKTTLLAVDSINRNFQWKCGFYGGCCIAYNIAIENSTYPIEDSDPGVSIANAKIYKVNSDRNISAVEHLLPYLNKKLNHERALGKSSYDFFEDLRAYLSPVQYADNTDYKIIPPIHLESDIGSNPPTKKVDITSNKKSPKFTIGKPITNISTFGSYTIERTEMTHLPFHLNMPVTIRIFPTLGNNISYPQTVSYNEQFIDYGIINSVAPQIKFDTDHSSLLYSKVFTSNTDVLTINFTVKVHNDIYNPSSLTQNLSNIKIKDAKINPASSNTGLTDGEYIKYSNSIFKVNGVVQPTAFNNNFSAYLNIDNITFIPFLRELNLGVIAKNQIICSDGAVDHKQNHYFDYTFSQISSDGATKVFNDNVQVVPLYYNYYIGNVLYSEKVMDINAFKTFWHNYMCVQYHPYRLDNDAEEIKTVSCADAEANNILSTITSTIANLIEQKKSKLDQEYFKNCAVFTSLKDNFVMTYTLGYHHYTLYYYDRAGNLVRTVPPAGVDFNATNRQTAPLHTQITEYNYNSLNQVTSQNTPDGGVSNFFYDLKGNMRFSINAKQAVAASNKASFTKYDNLGRVIFVGQCQKPVNMIDDCNNETKPTIDLTNANANMSDIVRTVYTDAYIVASNPFTYCASSATQQNLLNRVSYTISDADANLNTKDDQVVTIYSYDRNGNVEWIASLIADMPPNYVRYEYDLVSGSVTQVVVNECDMDAWFQKYTYNTDKKIVDVFTSKDGVIWDNDAHYSYFKHGPLQNTIIGQDKVQKVNFAYTIEGWLKGINHLSAENSFTTPYGDVPFAVPDLFAYKIHYYAKDFDRVGSGFNTNTTNYGFVNSPGQLFNGNISGIATYIHNPDQNTSVSNHHLSYGQVYRYDELNRLVQAKYVPGSFLAGSNSITNPVFTSIGPDMKEKFTYDANGNIKTLQRNDLAGVQYDNLTYNYNATKINQLVSVSDARPNNLQPATFDIKSQSSTNYAYDEIGNMIRDKSLGISTASTSNNIVWNNFGKIKTVTIPTSSTVNKVLTFLYDATGNRVAKFTRLSNSTMTQASEQEYYVRDASGNILSNLRRTNKKVGSTVYSDIVTTEQPIYGSARLGVHYNGYTRANVVYNQVYSNTLPLPNTLLSIRQQVCYRKMNNKRYELADHLGNTRAIFGDYLLSTISGTAPYTFTQLHAHQTAMYNYYAFGSPKPNTYSTSTNAITAQDQYYDDPAQPNSMIGINCDYRYSFNSQEKTDEIAGAGNHTTAKFWEYSTRLGIRWNTDPVVDPSISPYATNEDNPIKNSDPNGDCATCPPPQVNASIGIKFGSHNNGVSFKLSVTQNIGDFSLSAGVGVTQFSSFMNTGKSGTELRGSAMAGYDDGKLGLSLGTNVFRGLGGMSEFKQRTGILNFRAGSFSGSYENDGTPFPKLGLSDGNDSYRTAAARIGVGDFSAGFNLFTGFRKDYSDDKTKMAEGAKTGNFGVKMPHGFVKEEGTPYRMGALYAGYGQAMIGITSDRYVRHPIQDIFAHHTLSPQPGFQTLSKSVTPFYQISTPNPFRPISSPRFTLYD
jgi:Bacterial toxin 23